MMLFPHLLVALARRTVPRSRFVRTRATALAVLWLAAACAPARASTMAPHSPLGVCNCAMCQGFTAAGAGPGSAGFVFFNPITAWDPGPNAARQYPGAVPTPAPGSATFSIVGAGHVDVSGFDAAHGAETTLDITELLVPGFAFNDYVSVVNWALNKWDAVSGFTNLGYVPDSGAEVGDTEAHGGNVADIRVAAFEITTSSQLAHSFQPGTEAIFGVGGTIAGDIHIDVNRIWEDDPTDTIADPDYDIYTLVLHEVGHALGLQHSSVAGSVMSAAYGGARRDLTADDIAGIQALYGVPEPSSIVLLALGLAGLACVARRRRHVHSRLAPVRCKPWLGRNKTATT